MRFVILSGAKDLKMRNCLISRRRNLRSFVAKALLRMTNLMILGIFSQSLLVTACWDSPVEPLERENLSFSTVHKDHYSGISHRRGEVIVNAGRWEAVWQEIHSYSSSRPPLPPIDFGKETLVLAAMGEEPDACWLTEIEEILATKESLRVRVLEKRSPMSCACPAVVVHPVHVVRIPRHDRPGTFSFDRVIAGEPCR